MLDQLDLQQVLVLDIETVPQYAHFKQMPEHFQNLWAQKTQYQRKDEETAEIYYPRAGIWAEFGKIVCISVGVFIHKSQHPSFRVKSFYGDDEHQILVDFTHLLNKQPTSLMLCAHNGKEFDFPYLCRRMLINGLKIPTQLDLSGKKPWEVNHLDTMELWKFGDYKNYTSLELLAAIFNIPTPKDDMKGSEVYQVYWEQKNLERIKTYCQKDVITTAQLLLRYKGLPLMADDHIALIES